MSPMPSPFEVIELSTNSVYADRVFVERRMTHFY